MKKIIVLIGLLLSLQSPSFAIKYYPPAISSENIINNLPPNVVTNNYQYGNVGIGGAPFITLDVNGGIKNIPCTYTANGGSGDTQANTIGVWDLNSVNAGAIYIEESTSLRPIFEFDKSLDTITIGSNGTSLFDIIDLQPGVTGIIKLNGSISFASTVTQNIVAGTGITSAMFKSIIRIAGNSGAVDITADPQIAAGIDDGQVIKFIGQHDTNTVTFDDGTGLQLEGGASFVMGLGDILQLTYDSSRGIWLEDFRSDN